MPAALAKQPTPEVVCDIGRTGHLLDFGLNPFTKAYEASDASVQTEDRNRRVSAGVDFTQQPANGQQPASGHHPGVITQQHGKSPPAAQVLRLVVGLLGLEVHAKPKSWSEVWLTFQDTTNNKLGLGGQFDLHGSENPSASGGKSKGLSGGTGGDHHAVQQMDWQMRVLSLLRKHVLRGSSGRSGATDDNTNMSMDATRQGRLASRGGDDPSLDFSEHLEVAEHVMRRITHAVGVLQDPEKQERPIALREYTEKMVLEVCQDLRQWLEQLATLLSLYHVHILDLAGEKCRLQGMLDTLQVKNAEEERGRKDAVRRHNCLKENWEEEKMRRRAEALLGITLDGDDEKIYSQKDVDNFQKEWETEHVEPLLEQIRELRRACDLGKKKNNMGRSAMPVSGSLSAEAVSTLVQALNSLGERLPDVALSDAVELLADAVCRGGSALPEALHAINRLPMSAMAMGGPAGSQGGQGSDAMHRSLAACLAAVGAELETLERRVRACPEQRGLSALATWARESLAEAREALQAEAPREPYWGPAPSWDLADFGRRTSRSLGVNTGGVQTASVAQGSAPEVVALRLQGLQEELEAKLREALAQAEAWKKRWEEAMQRMADESAKADQLLADLRKRLTEMESILQQSGVGKQAADAIYRSGLSEFMQGRDVFERLYRDALNRMRRLAEAQARIFEESSQEFLRALAALTDPALADVVHRRPAVGTAAPAEGHTGGAAGVQAPVAQAPGHRTLAGASGTPADGPPLQVLRLGHERSLDIRSNQLLLRPARAHVRDGWGEPGMLPRLECRGRPLGSPLRSASPAKTAAADGEPEAPEPLGQRSRSPLREEPAPEPTVRAEPLVVGNPWGPRVGGLHQPSEKVRKGGSRPSTSGSGHRPGVLSRNSRNISSALHGSTSMPHLREPRLLVQSIGLAH